MSTSASVEFRLPEGWTLRKVAAMLAREWLPPFLADTGPKAPRWVLQPVVEAPEKGALPLWEAGISTADYEERLDHADLAWAIRANVARGRGKGTILARLRLDAEDRETIHMTIFPAPLPESLFDSTKVDEYLQARDTEGLEGLLVNLLSAGGILPVEV